MKILFLSRLFYPHIGGVEKHVLEISTRLIKDGYTVSIITEQYDKTLSKTETIDGITIYRINCKNDNRFKKFKIWKKMWQLRKVVKDADIIHCHDVFFWYLPFRFFYLHKPVYTTFHGYESYPILKKAVLVRKLSEKMSFGNICIGDFIPKWYGTKPTLISYGAVDISKIKPQTEKVKKDSAIFIGRLDDQTGILTYTKAVELLLKKYPKFDLIIVGEGIYRRQIEKKFTVLGFQKNPEKYLPKYHYALVSRYLSILEAFAAKRLVFAAYDNPVKEDYLKMAPFAKWIVIEKDPKKLAEKIQYYIKHPEEEQVIIENGYEWVKKQTWENIVSLYLNLWNRKTI